MEINELSGIEKQFQYFFHFLLYHPRVLCLVHSQISWILLPKVLLAESKIKLKQVADNLSEFAHLASTHIPLWEIIYRSTWLAKPTVKSNLTPKMHNFEYCRRWKEQKKRATSILVHSRRQSKVISMHYGPHWHSHVGQHHDANLLML